MTLCVGFVRPKLVSGKFMESLVTLALARKMPAGWIGLESGPRIASARNEVVRGFLRSDASHLLFIDTDMDFDVEHVDRLMASADEDTILGGLCFTGDGDVYPTLYRMTLDDDGKFTGKEILLDYPDDQLVEVEATGAAFLLIPRKVLEALEKTFSDKTAYPWFAEGERDLVEIGEDITFCLRARSLGFRIMVDTGVVIRHLKDRLVDDRTFRAEQVPV